MSIVAEALAKLEARVEEIEFEDDFDLCHFISLASRMKALGEDKYFNQIREICNTDTYRGNVDTIIRENAKRMMWDLDEQDGEELALTIIEVQDWHCFRQFTLDSDLYDKSTGLYMDQAAEEANLKTPDPEAASLLRSWLDTYPIPEDLRLPVVDTPLTDFDYMVMDIIQHCC